ncbi:hypothetical protein CBER1_02450 [Cercospora berteroae]|uniref:Uncharacterized protein n=1 Tax=Cercospora berteroae TaxID=357750 RepID=A0A2S6CIA0_9PEZI|nr:hypothetical protein CBER1_02450 [Cercospora berteroae]
MSGPSNSKPGAQPIKESAKPTAQPAATKSDRPGMGDAKQASNAAATFAGVPTGPRSLSKRPAQYRRPEPKAASTAPIPGVPTGPRAMRKPMQQVAVSTDPEMSKLSDQEIEQKLMANKAEAERIARRLATLEAEEAADRESH